ncbi:MAG: hypothetical protein PPHEESC_1913 [uncultured Paraburkholderia sp.]|nr:MAG: hypothetical protein PPHEESC_1913 [uncultured Paraburkholderia sp.]
MFSSGVTTAGSVATSSIARGKPRFVRAVPARSTRYRSRHASPRALTLAFHAGRVPHEPRVHVPLALLRILDRQVVEALVERFVVPAFKAIAFVGDLVFDQTENVCGRLERHRFETLHNVDGKGRSAKVLASTPRSAILEGLRTS